MHPFITKPIQGISILSILLLSCTQPLTGKGKEEIKASAIIKMIDKEQEIILDNKTITGDLDFSQVEAKTKIHSTLSQSIIKISLSFTNCQFTGKVICSGKTNGGACQSVFVQNLIFNSCEFAGQADFQAATVYGNVSFAGSQFKDVALFNSFYSHAKASYFGQIVAEKDFSFQDALFVGSCDFFKSQFKANVNFQGSRFDGSFNFSTVQCDLRTDFSKVRFNNNCSFNYSTFAGIARFNQLRSLGMADFIQVNFNNDAIFTNALFYDICKFNGSKVAAGFDFTSTVFYRSAPILEKTEVANPSLFKTGNVLQQDNFVLPKINE